LEVNDNRLSLKAEQASVKAILGAIERQMQIEMVVRLRQDRHVTVAFSALPLQDALKRLGLSAATVIEKDRQDLAVRTKIVVLDQGVATSVSPPAGGSSRERESPSLKVDAAPTALTGAAPFKLEIDPSNASQKP
jgi:hypothetical protein